MNGYAMISAELGLKLVHTCIADQRRQAVAMQVSIDQFSCIAHRLHISHVKRQRRELRSKHLLQFRGVACLAYTVHTTMKSALARQYLA